MQWCAWLQRLEDLVQAANRLDGRDEGERHAAAQKEAGAPVVFVEAIQVDEHEHRRSTSSVTLLREEVESGFKSECGNTPDRFAP